MCFYVCIYISIYIYTYILSEVVKVWIVGFSIIWQAFSHARLNGGSNLDFSPMEANIWWQGKGGMRWRHLLPKIRQMLRYEDPPHFLVLHCGGNDIGQIKSSELRKNGAIFRCTFSTVAKNKNYLVANTSKTEMA